MGTMRRLTNALAILLAAATPALAADAAGTRGSGILVLLFLGLFAVIVVAQLVPAIVMLLGVIKGVAGTTKTAGEEKDKTTETSDG